MEKDKETKKELEEKVEKLEKSNNIMKGLFIVLVVAICVSACFGFGFIVGGKLAEKEEIKDEKKKDDSEDTIVEKEEEESELEKLTKDSAVVKKLFEVFREDENCFVSSLWNFDSGEAAKKFIAYQNIDSSDIKDVKCGDLDDSFVDMYYCAMNDEASKYYGSDEKKYELAIKNETTNSFSEVVFEKKYKEFFGKDSVINHDDFSIGDGPIAHYDKTNKLYAEYNCQCGGMCGSGPQTLDSITQKGMSLILNTTIDDDDKHFITYTFEYEKETGNYIFVSRKAS